MRYVFIFFLFCNTFSSLCQEDDSLSYSLFKDKIVLYGDLGMNSSPFSLKDNFVGGYDRIQFKHNLKARMGIGVMYKWFALRLGFTLPGTLRRKSIWGRSNATELGISFNLKKLFWDIDFRSYRGYVVKDAYRWNDTLSKDEPNEFRPGIRSSNLSIHAWYLKNPAFKMPAVLGKVGHYNRQEQTFYLKSTLNLFGVSDSLPLTPAPLIDTTETKSMANTISALDIGLVPGYAYVNRVRNWQFSAFAGIGGVVQAKFYSVGKLTRGFLGIAPRIDLRLLAGFSKSRYFFWIVSDFDIKSIRYKETSYAQTYYQLKFVGGVRLNKKKGKKKKA